MANVRIKDLSTTASTTASDDFFGVDGATNGTRKLNAYSPTFGGNLTVSGTGTSSVAGNTNIGGTSSTGSYRLAITGPGTAASTVGGIVFRSSTTDTMYAGNITSDNSTDFEFWNPRNGYIRFATNNAERMRLNASGNLLLGTTTDGGQKLQVNGTAYVSGDATFAGNVILDSAAAANYVFIRGANSNAVPILYLGSGYGGGSQQVWAVGSNIDNAGTFVVRDSTASANLLSIAKSTGNATFAGSIAIGNTVQTAVSVASTHKVTISIGGSTYYLLATNV